MQHAATLRNLGGESREDSGHGRYSTIGERQTRTNIKESKEAQIVNMTIGNTVTDPVKISVLR